MSENETNAEQAAKEYGIKISKPKGVPVTKEGNVISSAGVDKKGGKKPSALKLNNSGVLSSSNANLDKKVKPEKEVKKIEKVAIFSSRNVRWPGVGELGKGYNIVTPEIAEQWLSREYVREATPEEVAQNFER